MSPTLNEDHPTIQLFTILILHSTLLIYPTPHGRELLIQAGCCQAKAVLADLPAHADALAARLVSASCRSVFFGVVSVFSFLGLFLLVATWDCFGWASYIFFTFAFCSPCFGTCHLRFFASVWVPKSSQLPNNPLYLPSLAARCHSPESIQMFVVRNIGGKKMYIHLGTPKKNRRTNSRPPIFWSLLFLEPKGAKRITSAAGWVVPPNGNGCCSRWTTNPQIARRSLLRTRQLSNSPWHPPFGSWQRSKTDSEWGVKDWLTYLDKQKWHVSKKLTQLISTLGSCLTQNWKFLGGWVCGRRLSNCQCPPPPAELEVGIGPGEVHTTLAAENQRRGGTLQALVNCKFCWLSQSRSFRGTA